MKQLTLQSKLFCLLALPLAGAILFGTFGALERKKKADNHALLESNSAVLRHLGLVVHELQKERGRSAVFIGSKGTKFVSELPAQQRETDAQAAQLNEKLKAFNPALFGPKLVASFEDAMKRLGELSSKRAAIQSVAIPGSESTAYFTQTIASLLNLSVKVSHAVDAHEVAGSIASYVNFLQVKERAGIERAVMATVFSNDKFQGDELTRFNRAVAAQETFHLVFSSYATDEQLKFLADTVQGTPVKEVERMRQIAVDKAATGGFGVVAAAWFDAITAKMDLMKQVEDKLAVDYLAIARQANTSARRAAWLFGAAMLAIVALTACFGIWTIRGIAGSLRKVIDNLQQGSTTLSDASGQIASASQSLAQGAGEQAASLEETGAALEELTSMVKRNAESALKAKDLSTQTRSSADASAEGVDRMKEAMDAIKGSNSDVAKIIKSIDEIAFQTNILALNAAVEAARAGEAGAGFSVVAEEVRNLAQRSALAARETAEKIDDALSKTAQGVQVTSTVADGLQDIILKARQVDDLVGQIATASREQSDGITQVNLAVNQMDKVTQSNAASAEETASASEELSAQAQSMKDTVADLSTLIGGAGSGRSTPAAHAGSSASPVSSGPTRGNAKAPQPLTSSPRKTNAKEPNATRSTTPSHDSEPLTF